MRSTLNEKQGKMVTSLLAYLKKMVLDRKSLNIPESVYQPAKDPAEELTQAAMCLNAICEVYEPKNTAFAQGRDEWLTSILGIRPQLWENAKMNLISLSSTRLKIITACLLTGGEWYCKFDYEDVHQISRAMCNHPLDPLLLPDAPLLNPLPSLDHQHPEVDTQDVVLTVFLDDKHIILERKDQMWSLSINGLVLRSGMQLTPDQRIPRFDSELGTVSWAGMLIS